MEELVGDQRVGVRGQSACLAVPAIRLGLINVPDNRQIDFGTKRPGVRLRSVR